jgi:hypothetical protein
MSKLDSTAIELPVSWLMMLLFQEEMTEDQESARHPKVFLFHWQGNMHL